MHLKMPYCFLIAALATLFALVQAPPCSQAAGEKKLEVFS